MKPEDLECMVMMNNRFPPERGTRPHGVSQFCFAIIGSLLSRRLQAVKSATNGNTYSALEVDGNGSAYLYTNKADTDLSLHFLEQISQTDPCSEHIVIWEGAGFHPNAKHECIPANVTVLKQPAYSPELNCVEKLLDLLRNGLCNRSWKDLNHLLDQATRWLKEFWERPERIKSLVGQGWLLVQVNA